MQRCFLFTFFLRIFFFFAKYLKITFLCLLCECWYGDVFSVVVFFLVKWFLFFLELSLAVWKSALIVLIHFLNRPPQSSNKPKKFDKSSHLQAVFFSFSVFFFWVFFNGTCVFAPFLQNLLEQQKKFSKDDFIGWNIYLERRLCIRVDVEMCFLE